MAHATQLVRDLPLAVASMSIGRAWAHDMDIKLAEIARVGLKGVEIFFEDVVYAAKKIDPIATETDEGPLLEAAGHIRTLCDKYGLTVLVLQPLINYEGLLDDAKHREALVKCQLFFKLAKILGTDMIQVPSQMLMQGTTGDIDKIVADLREIGEMGLKEDPPIKLAYECMAWGAHVDTWEQTWDIVERVDLPNFGIVLDTFQILGRIWADPTEASGKLASGPTSLAATISTLKSLAPKLLPKVFYIQLCDAELLSPPLSPAHPFYDPEQKPRMMWSRNARLFPCEYEKGAYLPVIELAKAIFDDLGYRGWVSLEVFARSAAAEGQHVPREHAERATKSWECFLAEAEFRLSG